MWYIKALAAGAVIAVVLLVVALVLVASSGGDDNEASATPTATFVGQPSTTGGPSTAVTGSPTATAEPGGPEAALDVPEAGGTVALQPGSYRTARFQPEAHFSIQDGWSAQFDTARFVQLFRGDDAGANCVCFINPDGVFENGAKQALPGAGTVDDLITWLTSNADLKTSSPSSLQVGNLSGRQLDVELKTGTALDYLSAGEQKFGVKVGEKQHLTVLAFRGAPLIIAQRSATADYTDYFPFVEQVVGGLTFAN
jgi:hypothetical protein